MRGATDVTRHRLTPSSPIAYASAPWLQASEIQPTDRVGLRLTRSELKIELWIDDYTYEGAWNRKFSWQGELINTYQVTGPPTAP